MRTGTINIIWAVVLLSANPVLAGKDKAVPDVLMAGSADSTQIFDSLDPSTAGYPAWTALEPDRSPCDRRPVERLFGPALKRLLEEREKQNRDQPGFGIPEFPAPAGLLKKYLKRHCRLGSRPTVAAHGPGWVKKIRLEEFSAKISPSSFGPGVFLSISAATRLNERPFFYSTIVPSSDKNHYRPASDAEVPAEKIGRKKKHLIEEALSRDPDSDESGSMRFFRDGRGGLLVRVERTGTRGTHPRYPANWADYLFLPEGRKKAWVVFRGDSDFVRESNQMELNGVLDMDGDGDLDVLLQGNQCIVLARRTANGFQSFRLSNLF